MRLSCLLSVLALLHPPSSRHLDLLVDLSATIEAALIALALHHRQHEGSLSAIAVSPRNAELEAATHPPYLSRRPNTSIGDVVIGMLDQQWALSKNRAQSRASSLELRVRFVGVPEGVRQVFGTTAEKTRDDLGAADVLRHC